MASIQLSFGKCIRFYRNKIGLSQEKFALLINIMLPWKPEKGIYQ